MWRIVAIETKWLVAQHEPKPVTHRKANDTIELLVILGPSRKFNRFRFEDANTVDLTASAQALEETTRLIRCAQEVS